MLASADGRVKLDLPFETTLRALMKIDPESDELV